MATDQLLLGGVTFDDWSTPEQIGFGGNQALKVHKLPGGSRVFDLLGPDDADIQWSGQFYSESAPEMVAAIDAMRVSGNPVGLSFAGNFRLVIVQSFLPVVMRYPQHYSYSIQCSVVSNPMAGAGGGVASTFADLISADMASALSVVGL